MMARMLTPAHDLPLRVRMASEGRSSGTATPQGGFICRAPAIRQVGVRTYFAVVVDAALGAGSNLTLCCTALRAVPWAKKHKEEKPDDDDQDPHESFHGFPLSR